MKQSRRFVAKQSKTLAALGVHPDDIERTFLWVERNMPDDEDARTWQPNARDLDALLTDESGIEDARQAWRRARAVPTKFRSLLDAIEET